MVKNIEVIAEYKNLKESLKSINYFRYIDAVENIKKATSINNDYKKLKALVSNLYDRELKRQDLNIFEMDVLCGKELFSYLKKEKFNTSSQKEKFIELIRLIVYKGKNKFNIKYHFDPNHINMNDIKDVLDLSDVFLTNYIYEAEELTYFEYYLDPEPSIKKENYSFPIPNKAHINIKHGEKLRQIESYFYTYYYFLTSYCKLITDKEKLDALTAKLSLIMGRFLIDMPAYYYYNGIQIKIAMAIELLEVYNSHNMNKQQMKSFQIEFNNFISDIEFALHFKYKDQDRTFITLKDASFYVQDANNRLLGSVSGFTSLVWPYHLYVKSISE